MHFHNSCSWEVSCFTPHRQFVLRLTPVSTTTFIVGERLSSSRWRLNYRIQKTERCSKRAYKIVKNPRTELPQSQIDINHLIDVLVRDIRLFDALHDIVVNPLNKVCDTERKIFRFHFGFLRCCLHVYGFSVSAQKSAISFWRKHWGEADIVHISNSHCNKTVRSIYHF